jgi:hypothetical protein
MFSISASQPKWPSPLVDASKLRLHPCPGGICREDELASLVTKLEGCTAELEASDQKKKQMANRGMEGISADIESGKRKLEDK